MHCERSWCVFASSRSSTHVCAMKLSENVRVLTFGRKRFKPPTSTRCNSSPPTRSISACSRGKRDRKPPPLARDAPLSLLPPLLRKKLRGRGRVQFTTIARSVSMARRRQAARSSILLPHP
eukprot:752205-Hanusia_phi.AAC.1